MSRVDEIRGRLSTAARAFSWLGAIGVARDDVVYLLDVAAAAEELLEMHVGGTTCLHHDRLIAALNRAPSSGNADGARVRAAAPVDGGEATARAGKAESVPPRGAAVSGSSTPREGTTVGVTPDPAARTPWRRQRPW